LAGPAGAATYVYENPTPITINDAPSVGVPATASPYPSVVTIPTLPRFASPASGVKITLQGVTHTSAADIGVALRSPRGTTYQLLANAGGTGPVTDATLTFTAPAGVSMLIPYAGPMVSGTYPPSAYTETGSAGHWSPWLSSVYVEQGAWGLLVGDDEPDDIGTIARGWKMEFSATPANAIFQSAIVIKKKAGSARLRVRTPNAGTLTLERSKTVKGMSIVVPKWGSYVIPIKARGKTLTKLNRRGRAQISAIVRFETPGAPAYLMSTKVNLVKKLKKKH
ncbi:MAG TPA: hypothetical protein VNT22_07615, partial [Baekduia sp.]|nr:hypothetical protein [Baekduia sp.]